MEIRTKLYPYPVLAYYTNDFKKGNVFSVEAIPEIDGFKQQLVFNMTLKNPDLQSLITEGKAEIIYHLECAQTGYREYLSVSEPTTVYPIKEANISGRLQVCPFILAKCDLDNYTNSEVVDELSGLSFQVETGNILAVAKQINVKVKKKTDDLRSLPSIINVILNGDSTEKYMVIDYDGKLINVLLPDEEWNRIDTLSANNALRPVINCLIAVPALSFVLSRLQRMSVSDRQSLDDDERTWYDCIKRSLLNIFKIDVESTDFDNMDALKLAQQLVNGPLNHALQCLSGGDS